MLRFGFGTGCLGKFRWVTTWWNRSSWKRFLWERFLWERFWFVAFLLLFQAGWTKLAFRVEFFTAHRAVALIANRAAIWAKILAGNPIVIQAALAAR